MEFDRKTDIDKMKDLNIYKQFICIFIVCIMVVLGIHEAETQVDSFFTLSEKNKQKEFIQDRILEMKQIRCILKHHRGVWEEIYKVSQEEAKQIIRHGDWKRKAYHNYHCKGKWGDSRNYDISINSSKLGIEKTTDMLEHYIRERIDVKNNSRLL